MFELFLLFFTVMNNAAVNIYVKVVVWTYVFISLGYVYLEVELLGHVVIFCLTYEINCIVLLNITLLVEFTLVVLYAKSEFCHIAFTTILCNAILLFFAYWSTVY